MPVTEKIDVTSEIDAAFRRGATDPYAIAKKIAPLLDDEQKQEYALLYLADVAKRRAGEIRRGSFVEEVREQGGTVAVSFNASKFAMARVADADDTWMKYRDLTYDACMRIAEAREQYAAGAVREAKRMRSLAAAIKKHGVKTAGELPESVLVEVLK